jgi:hypothetical protein
VFTHTKLVLEKTSCQYFIKPVFEIITVTDKEAFDGRNYPSRRMLLVVLAPQYLLSKSQVVQKTWGKIIEVSCLTEETQQNIIQTIDD